MMTMTEAEVQIRDADGNHTLVTVTDITMPGDDGAYADDVLDAIQDAFVSRDDTGIDTTDTGIDITVSRLDD